MSLILGRSRCNRRIGLASQAQLCTPNHAVDGEMVRIQRATLAVTDGATGARVRQVRTGAGL